MLGEEDLEGVQLLRDALDVVEAVNADDDFAVLEASLEPVETLLDDWELDSLDELPGVDADREGADLDPAVLELDAVGLSLEAKDTRTCTQEVAGVVVCVEADQIALEDTEEDLTSDWEDPGNQLLV